MTIEARGQLDRGRKCAMAAPRRTPAPIHPVSQERHVRMWLARTFTSITRFRRLRTLPFEAIPASGMGHYISVNPRRHAGGEPHGPAPGNESPPSMRPGSLSIHLRFSLSPARARKNSLLSHGVAQRAPVSGPREEMTGPRPLSAASKPSILSRAIRTSAVSIAIRRHDMRPRARPLDQPALFLPGAGRARLRGAAAIGGRSGARPVPCGGGG
jgi:hypothetical protein